MTTGSISTRDGSPSAGMPLTNVVLDAGDVSGYHAEIHCDSGSVYVVDLGSSNGTTVNGERLTKRQKLAAWDRVSFASVEAEIVDTEERRPTQMSRAVGEPAPSPAGAEWRLVGETGDVRNLRPPRPRARRRLRLHACLGFRLPAPRAAGTWRRTVDGDGPRIHERHVRQREAGSGRAS